MNVKQ
jgi:hypothetical protein